MMKLSVLLVEDNLDDLEYFKNDLPSVFNEKGVDVDIHPCSSFEDAMRDISSVKFHFDIIISDTYKGEYKNLDAAVLSLVRKYREERKYTTIIVYSASSKPHDLEEGPFVIWADKSKTKEKVDSIENAINKILDIGIPQIGRQLYNDLEYSNGEYLWEFLNKNWEYLTKYCNLNFNIFERLVRNRAAIKIGKMHQKETACNAIENITGLEYYIYPSFNNNYYNMGDIIKNKYHSGDRRVILTPHCFLFQQEDQARPRADYILTVKTVLASELISPEKRKNILSYKENELKKYNDSLKKYARSPAQTDKRPEGRHWFLPGFLDIPHSFCDFLQIESIGFDELSKNYTRIATLSSPFAEALQNCFSTFYSSVGIPEIIPESISSILNDLQETND